MNKNERIKQIICNAEKVIADIKSNKTISKYITASGVSIGSGFYRFPIEIWYSNIDMPTIIVDLNYCQKNWVQRAINKIADKHCEIVNKIEYDERYNVRQITVYLK